jgi:hypothetical protein
MPAASGPTGRAGAGGLDALLIGPLEETLQRFPVTPLQLLERLRLGHPAPPG